MAEESNLLGQHKIESQNWNTVPMLEVKLPLLDAEFSMRRCEWRVKNRDKSKTKSSLQSQFEREKLRHQFLLHWMADKETQLITARRDIARLILENSRTLEAQGFPTEELIEKAQIWFEEEKEHRNSIK
jgi:hypothetical protein